MRKLPLVLAYLLIVSPAFAQSVTLPIMENHLPKSTEGASPMDSSRQMKALMLMQQGKTDEAIREAEAAVEDLKKNNDPSEMGSVYALLGKIYRRADRYDDSIKAYQQAMEFWKTKEGGQNFLIGMILNNLGEEYKSMGQWDKALSTLLEAKTHFKDGDPNYWAVEENLGSVYFHDGKLKEAEQSYLKALENAKGKDKRSEAYSNAGLGMVYAKQGRTDEAKAAFKDAIAVSEAAFGADGVQTADLKKLQEVVFSPTSAVMADPGPEWRALMDSAAIAMKEKNYIQAVSLFESAVDFVQKKQPESAAAALAVSSLGAAYLKSGASKKAQETLTQALPLCEKYLTSQPELTAGVKKALESLKSDSPEWRAAMDLGSASYKKGNYLDAAGPLATAVKIAESFGPNDVRLGISLNAQAANYLKLGKATQAEPLSKRALQIVQKTGDKDGFELSTNLNNLSNIYRAEGKYKEAEPLMKEALALLEKKHGADSNVLEITINNLAELYKAQGRYAQAEPLYKRSLAIAEKSNNQEDLSIILDNLGDLYLKQRKAAAAKPIFERSLEIAKKTTGADSLHTATVMNNLANANVSAGQYAVAEKLLKQTLEIQKKKIGSSNPSIAMTMNNLSQIYVRQKRFAEAESFGKQAVAMDEAILGPNHPDLALCLNNLGATYFMAGKVGQAEPLMKRALAIRTKVLGPNNPTVAMNMLEYSLILQRLNRIPEAIQYQARARAILAAKK